MSSKRIVLGITGSIAAYKGAELVRLMTAKKWDFAALAFSASSLARRRASSASFLSVMSSPIPWVNCSLRSELKNPRMIQRCHRIAPSGSKTLCSLTSSGFSGVSRARFALKASRSSFFKK